VVYAPLTPPAQDKGIFTYADWCPRGIAGRRCGGVVQAFPHHCDNHSIVQTGIGAKAPMRLPIRLCAVVRKLDSGLFPDPDQTVKAGDCLGPLRSWGYSDLQIRSRIANTAIPTEKGKLANGQVFPFNSDLSALSSFRSAVLSVIALIAPARATQPLVGVHP
jgi:hypothetical protein